MDAIIAFLLGNWLAISALAPMFWALANIIDVYFVGKVYVDAVEGTVISGMFQALPLLLVIKLAGFGPADIAAGNTFDCLGYNPFFVAFLGGVFFGLSVYFYFGALFKNNDASLLQVVWNLTVLAVPLILFIFFKESLSGKDYLGMFVCFFGATLLSADNRIKEKISGKYFSMMIVAVISLSISMVLQGKVYDSLIASIGQRGFWLGFVFFGAGIFCFSALLAVITKRNPSSTIKKYYKTFILLEGISFLGNLASQKALDIAPSASYVAVIELFVPVFIMIYSAAILFLAGRYGKIKKLVLGEIYSRQIIGYKTKIIAMIVMALGVILIG